MPNNVKLPPSEIDAYNSPGPVPIPLWSEYPQCPFCRTKAHISTCTTKRGYKRVEIKIQCPKCGEWHTASRQLLLKELV